MRLPLLRSPLLVSGIFAILLVAGGRAPLHSAPIHDAAATGDSATVFSLIEEYPTMLELRDQRGASPLYHAAWNGHAGLVQALIERGAEATVATSDGLTPLHGSALNGHLDVSRILLDNGADVNARSTVQRNTPLHVVWKGGHAEIAALLIERGADINAVEKWYGMTPLHYAAEYGRVELIRTLLLGGADASVRDKSGRTAEELARSEEAAALFRSNGTSR